MDRLFVLWLTLGALPLVAENRQTTVAPIALYVRFEQEPPESVVEALHDEVDVVMGPIGMTFEWRDLDAVRGTEVSTELAVLTFKGHCDLAGMSPKAVTNPGALGWTHVSDGVILPFSDIECDRIRGFLQKELVAMNPSAREATFGRSLGRVVAHELYHIFANTMHHGSCGVGKAAYSVLELIGNDFQFEGHDLAALRSGKTRGAVPAPTHNPAAPPPLVVVAPPSS